MTYKLAKPGWFADVNGFKVIRHPLPAWLDRGEFFAHHGIEWHRQDGPGDDIYATQVARGYTIAAFNVSDEGQVRQYTDAREAPWHGDSVSHYAFGIEHTGFAGTPCPTVQLDASAALCAALIEWSEDEFGETIPLVKVPRVSVSNYTTVRGFWDHLNVDRGPLNENGHVNRLEGRTWPAQLKKIGEYLMRQPRPAPTFHGTLLTRGVDAQDVMTWKRRMAVKGLFLKTSANDGPFFGDVIERVTKEFQTAKKLPVDGIVGPKTWAAAWPS